MRQVETEQWLRNLRRKKPEDTENKLWKQKKKMFHFLCFVLGLLKERSNNKKPLNFKGKQKLTYSKFVWGAS